MGRWSVIGLTAVLLWPATACMYDHREDAEALDQQIKMLPGVSNSSITRYVSDIVQGQDFQYAVQLTNDVTADQAATVGRTFVEQLHGKGLAEHYVTFRVGYRDSTASFDAQTSFADDEPTADDVAADLAAWLRRADALGADSAGLRLDMSERRRNASVTLTTQATDAQSVNISRTFITAHRGPAGITDSLTLGYPAAGKLPWRSGLTVSIPQSLAGFTFEATGPSVGQVADSIGVWLAAAHSPVAELVTLNQPSDRTPDDAGSRGMTVVLTPDATEATADALQASDLGLADASWIIKIPVEDTLGRSHDYTSTPNPPKDSDRMLWTQISDIVGHHFENEASAVTSAYGSQAVTTITIRIPRSANSDIDIPRKAREIAALLPGFGHPTSMVLNTADGAVELTVGGCYMHKIGHRRLPLEIELSQQYETC